MDWVIYAEKLGYRVFLLPLFITEVIEESGRANRTLADEKELRIYKDGEILFSKFLPYDETFYIGSKVKWFLADRGVQVAGIDF